MQKIKYKNSDINFTDNGTGSVVVLLHGYLESIDVWQDLILGLEQEYRVIAIDLPGHGKSGTLDGDHSMDKMAVVIYAVLENLKIEKCTMLGHSMGGYVTLAFAENHSEKLEAFGLFHSHPFADSKEKKQNRSREIDLIKLGKKELIFGISIPNLYAIQNREKLKQKIDFSMKIALSMKEEAIILSMQGMIDRPNRIHIVENIKKPVLMIIGEKDNLIPAETLKKVADNNKHISSTVLLKSGHMGFFEEPEKVLKAIREFLKNIKQ